MQGKTFYECAVVVDGPPFFGKTPVLFPDLQRLGGQGATCFISIIPVGDGTNVCPFAIIAVTDRFPGIDPATGAPYLANPDFYQEGMGIGVGGFLSKTYAGALAIVKQKYGQAVSDQMEDKDVGGYGLG